MVLLAGIGDPAGEDARFVGVEDNHLGLWLGRGPKTQHLYVAEGSLSKSEWHMVVAMSDGRRVTLFGDGKPLLTRSILQGEAAARLEMAPAPVADLGNRHFGGEIASLKILRTVLTLSLIHIFGRHSQRAGYQEQDFSIRVL